MNATTTAGVASVLCLMALAGCTGSFDIDQTEPFRVQLDGAPQTIVVREGGEPREVQVETCPEDPDPCDVEEVDVEVKVQKTSAEACSIKVIVKTVSGEVLEERVIDVGGSGGGGSVSATATSDGNMTGNETATASATATGDAGDGSGDTIVQNLIVNVKGNKNIIVVTQALQGEANVNIQAIKASGNADVDADQDTTAGSTTTVTATTSPTNSTTNTTTGPY